MKYTFTLLAVLSFMTASFAQQYQQTHFDIWAGSVSSRPNTLSAHNNTLYFYATNTPYGEELHYLDDQKNKAVLVKAIGQTPFSFPSPLPSGSMASMNGKLYFTAVDTIHGKELWVYDGTNPPSLIKDLNPGKTSSAPNQLTVLNNKLYFSAIDPTTPNGSEIFVYNPINNTINKVTDLGKYATFSDIVRISTYNDRLVFTCNNNHIGEEVYLYDPKINIAWMLIDIAQADMSSIPMNFVELNGKLYFTADDRANERQVYEYDGVNLPKRMTVLDNMNLHQATFDRTMAAYNGKLYFYNITPSSNGAYELYEFDPVSQKASQISYEQPFANVITNFTTADNKLFFVTGTTRATTNVWAYDGTGNPTPITNFSVSNNNVFDVTAVNNRIYFVANSDAGRELYRLTPSTTTVEKLTIGAQIKTYPNPAKDIFKLELDLKEAISFRVALYDMQGRAVYRSKKSLYSASNHTIEISLRNLPTGTYTYQITDLTHNEMAGTGKIIKQ